ncbi:MAG: hypothetical protein EOO38_06965 [Cytophagaceae bacterium]|nr:MAG: hypothetical protein EOO38_06965 [Cytophagaceae bacterium]
MIGNETVGILLGVQLDEEGTLLAGPSASTRPRLLRVAGIVALAAAISYASTEPALPVSLALDPPQSHPEPNSGNIVASQVDHPKDTFNLSVLAITSESLEADWEAAAKFMAERNQDVDEMLVKAGSVIDAWRSEPRADLMELANEDDGDEV